MAEHLDFGKQGEETAKNFLVGKGYKILDTNWHFGKMEVDIIATDKNFVVFVEVKTRSSTVYGEPEVAVTRDKQRFLIRAADAYIQKKGLINEARFDIVSVVVAHGKTTINHIEDAFYPTL